MNAGAVALVGVLVVGAGIAVYYVAKKSKAPATLVAQAPTPAVAGIQALGLLAGKGIDYLIAKKASEKEED
jgi:hypothetical protein